MATLQAERLGKRRAPGQGGPHQISRGFSAAVTRRDQLKAKADGAVHMRPLWPARAADPNPNTNPNPNPNPDPNPDPNRNGRPEPPERRGGRGWPGLGQPGAGSGAERKPLERSGPKCFHPRRTRTS